MRGFHRLWVAALALAALTGTASAQGYPAFNGLYLGVQLGFNMQSSDFEYSPGTTTQASYQEEGEETTVDAGMFLGFGRLTGRLFLGAEVDFGYGDGEIEIVRGGTRATLESDVSIGFSARAGYIAVPNLLVYARVGYALTSVETTLTSLGRVGNEDDYLGGFRVGGGVDYAFTSQLFGRVEYIYTGYEDYDFRIAATNERMKLDLDEHRVRFGIGYLF